MLTSADESHLYLPETWSACRGEMVPEDGVVGLDLGFLWLRSELVLVVVKLLFVVASS